MLFRLKCFFFFFMKGEENHVDLPFITDCLGKVTTCHATTSFSIKLHSLMILISLYGHPVNTDTSVKYYGQCSLSLGKARPNRWFSQ